MTNKLAQNSSVLPQDMRDAFFESLYELARRDRNLVLLTDDQGALSLEKFKKDLPGQYFNIGIAEQNMVSVAAGLALSGKRPYLYGISTFMTMRCYEQIRLDVCCMNLPVVIVGSGPGFTYGSDGPTHHATQDLALMRGLPEIMILNPPDAVMTAASARLTYDRKGPGYIRLEKGVVPSLYGVTENFQNGFSVLRHGADIVLVSTGVLTHQALKVADRLAKLSLEATVIDLYRLKPIDAKALGSMLAPAKRIATIEESSIIGGLGSAVMEILGEIGKCPPIQLLASPDKTIYDYGNREWLLSRCGLDVDGLTQKIISWMK